MILTCAVCVCDKERGRERDREREGGERREGAREQEREVGREGWMEGGREGGIMMQRETKRKRYHFNTLGVESNHLVNE